MLNPASLGLTDPVFTHQDPDTGAFNLFHIPTLDRLIKNTSACELEVLGVTKAMLQLPEEDRDIFLEKRGIEQHRLDRIPFPFDPIYCCMMPDETGLTVDGNHRMAVCYMRKLTHCPAYVIPQSVWEQCLVDHSMFPPEVMKHFLTGPSYIS